MAGKRTVQTYEFKRGQKLSLDDIYFVQGLAGGDWWDAPDPLDRPDGKDRSEEVTIKRSIRITIIIETP